MDKQELAGGLFQLSQMQNKWLHQLFAAGLSPSLFLSLYALTQTHKSPVLPPHAHVTAYSPVLRHKIYFTVPTALLPRLTSHVESTSPQGLGAGRGMEEGLWFSLF